MIDDATTDQDLRVPLGNHFKKLRGKPADFHSIRVEARCASPAGAKQPPRITVRNLHRNRRR